MLLDMVWFLGWPVQAQELDSMIIMSPFQLSLFYEKMSEKKSSIRKSYPYFFSKFEICGQNFLILAISGLLRRVKVSLILSRFMFVVHPFCLIMFCFFFKKKKPKKSKRETQPANHRKSTGSSSSIPSSWQPLQIYIWDSVILMIFSNLQDSMHLIYAK